MVKLKVAEKIVQSQQPLRKKLEGEIRNNLLYWYDRVDRASRILTQNERLKQARRAKEGKR